MVHETLFINKNILISEIAHHFYEAEKNILMFVNDDQNNTIGRITHQDIIKSIHLGKNISNHTVGAIMSTNTVVNLNDHITLKSILQQDKELNVFDIVENNQLIGNIVPIVNLKQILIKEDDLIIDVITNYISQGCAGNLLVCKKNSEEIIGKVMFKHFIKAYFDKENDFKDICVSDIMSRMVADVKTSKNLKEIINQMKKSTDIDNKILDVLDCNKLVAYVILN